MKKRNDKPKEGPEKMNPWKAILLPYTAFHIKIKRRKKK